MKCMHAVCIINITTSAQFFPHHNGRDLVPQHVALYALNSAHNFVCDTRVVLRMATLWDDHQLRVGG